MKLRDKTKIDQLLELHATKEATYQGSWCKRGELLSILPNILRKVDRLDVYVQAYHTNDLKAMETALAGESLMDTVCDLLVYLCKYAMYLAVGHDDFQLSQQHLETILTDAAESFFYLDTGDTFVIYMERVIDTLNTLADARMNGIVDDTTARETIASLYKYLTDSILTTWSD